MSIWSAFWRSLGLPGNCRWERLCERFGEDRYFSLAQKFMALAYRDSQTADPSVVDTLNGYAQALGFNYQELYQADDGFERELQKCFSVVLLRSANNHRQFLRTVRRYSGKMYVQFANRIGSAIRQHGWEWISDPENIGDVLQGMFNGYVNGNDESENALSRLDTVNFFLTLINLYRRCNQPFSVDDVLATDLGQMLTPEVARNIISKMCVEGAGSLSELDDTMPVIRLQEGRVALSLPAEGVFHDVGGVERIIFQFFSSASLTPVCFCRYERTPGGNVWQAVWTVGWNGSVFLEPGGGDATFAEIGHVRKVKVYADGRETTCDVTPQILCGHGHILLSAADGAVVSETAALDLGGQYKVISPDHEGVAVQCVTEERSRDLELANGFFTVPADAEQIMINGAVYDTRSDRYLWINKEERFRHIRNGGVGRLFFECSAPLLTENAMNDHSIGIFYICDDGTRREFPRNAEAGEDFLWQRRGRLQIARDGVTLVNCPVTFIPDVEQDDLHVPVGYGEGRDALIRFKYPNGEFERDMVHIDGTSDAAELDYRGYHFSFPIIRQGVYLQSRERGIFLPVRQETPGNKNILELADDDFDRLRLSVNTSENCTFMLVRGVTCKPFFPKHRKETLRWHCSQDPDLSKETSDDYSIVLQDGTLPRFYNFHRYSPLGTPFAGNVSYRLTQDGPSAYELSYFISHSCSKLDKVIIVYPAVRQEAPPDEIIPVSVSHAADDRGRCIETLQFDVGDGYDCGLICFAAFKANDGRYKVVSSGFFLRMGNAPDLPDDGLREFRLALDQMDVDGITGVLNTDDAGRRRLISDYIRQLNINAQNAKICEYLNSYRNKLTVDAGNMDANPSGYIFMAGWYFVDQVDRFGRFNANFRDYWDPLMIAYRYRERRGGGRPELGGYAQSFCNELRRIPDREVCIARLWRLIKGKLGHARGNCFFRKQFAFSYPHLSETMRQMVARYRSDRGIEHDFPKFKHNEMPRFEREYRADRWWFGAYERIIELLFGAWYLRFGNPRCGDFYNANRRCFNLFFNNNTRFTVKEFLDYFPALGEHNLLFYDGYDRGARIVFQYNEERGFSPDDLERFIESVARELHEWRMAPDLRTAQGLRETLLALQEIDNCLLSHLQQNPDCDPDYFIGLRDIIDQTAVSLGNQ